MNRDLYARIREHTPPDRRGTRLLLLYELAWYADPLGICWRSNETLAAAIREDEDYIRKLAKAAADDGDITRRSGRGRGNPTVYGILVGLDDTTRQRIMTIVAHTLVAKNVRYIEINGERIPYAAGMEDQFFPIRTPQKVVLHTPFSGANGENPPAVEVPIAAPPAPPPRSSRPSGAAMFNRVARRPADLPDQIRWLLFHEKITTAEDFANAPDLDALVEDYKARRAEGQGKGAIVKFWKTYGPPTQETMYGRHATENQTERSAAPSRPGQQRHPRIGDLDYY